MQVKIGAGREIKKLPSYLWDDELVERMTAGQYGPGQGLVVLTNLRLFFLKDGIMSKTTEDFPIDKVSSVQWSSGMLMGTITIFASGNKAEITNVNKSDGKAIVDQIRQRMSGSKVSPASAAVVAAAPIPQAPAVDLIDQLKRLGELRDAGVLTQEEFDSKKADLLSRM